jgi:hypothetical protein
MKTIRLILVVAAILVLTHTAFGQSSFALNNYRPFYGIDAPVFDALGVALEGPGYLAELWGGPTADSLSPAGSFSDWDRRAIVPFRTGFRTGGYVTYVDDAIVLSVRPFELAALQVRAWDASLGSTYEEVVARGLGGYGESPVFYAMGGNPLGLPTLPGPLIGLESFSLRPVIPEPSTWALFAMGGLAVLAFRHLPRQFKPHRRPN